ncbi:sensor histidine kinase [Falsiroseomonas tokyonensis]|uniref:histidine kinase n=1 Tax=Falsiroseomonas tokyonensis TaxID=430521 RepID=A0ABV7BT91_9PROT|nr:PAS domain-containing sensor histidine kinase [Falsiroseomonas tokyonensis]MBU8537326.1 sensor histidine kinase [Falsiroseomonas tokyonensis]
MLSGLVPLGLTAGGRGEVCAGDKDWGARTGADGIMKQAFSLWPSQQSPEALRVPRNVNGKLPPWASGMPTTALRGSRHYFQAAALVLAAAFAGGTSILALPGPGGAGASWRWLALALAGLALLAVFMLVLRLLDRLQRGEARAYAIFERAGVSLWEEDWTAASQAVLALKQQGIHDIQAHFTAHPEQARTLRRKVIIRNVNAFTVQMMGARGPEDFIGPLDRILPDTDQTFVQWLVALANGESVFRSEAHITRPDGSVIDTIFMAELPKSLDGFAHIVVTAIDITDYKAAHARLVAAETELARASRVITVGTLTASLAHEVNSPLAAIVVNAEACLRWMHRPIPDLAEAEAAIARVVNDATRARDVVARTRAFLSNTPRQHRHLDLTEAARDAIMIVERELRGHGVSMHFDADSDLPKVVADQIQIQQVLVNLLLNGAHAMAETPAPRDLTLTLRHVGQDVQVAVRDRGVGIAPEQLARIFQPFHSTRAGGMGMGLAICRNCVEAHGGRLWAESTLGEGSTFHVTLPAAGL